LRWCAAGGGRLPGSRSAERRQLLHAIEQGLEVLPVINKIDLPSADPDRVSQEIEEIIGIDATDAVRVSAKTGEGVPDLLEALVKRIPAPRAIRTGRCKR